MIIFNNLLFDSFSSWILVVLIFQWHGPQRPNSQSTFRQFDQNYLWQTLWISSKFRQYFQKMEFRKISDNLPKIQIHKEVLIFVWNCISRQRWQIQTKWTGFLAEFSATILLLNSTDFYWCQIVWIQQRNPKPFHTLFLVLCELGHRETQKLNNLKQKYDNSFNFIIGICRTPMWSICHFVQIQYFVNISITVLAILCKSCVSSY